MSNFTIAILVLFIVFWLYCLFSATTSQFKSKKVKAFWIIGLMFVPFLSFFYIFLKKDILKH